MHQGCNFAFKFACQNHKKVKSPASNARALVQNNEVCQKYKKPKNQKTQTQKKNKKTKQKAKIKQTCLENILNAIQLRI